MPRDSRALHDQDWAANKPSDEFFEGTQRYPDIAEVIVRLKPRRLFDVGCGSGFLAKLLKSRVPGLIVEGMDISEVALERAKAHLDRCWQADLDKADLPVESGQFDVVACVEVLEHVYDPDHALQEVHRLLAPGGWAVVTTPNLAYWRYRLDLLLRGRVPLPARDRRHLHQFDRDYLREAMAAAGFQDITFTGHAVRFPWLARSQPALFSDVLVAIAKKA